MTEIEDLERKNKELADQNNQAKRLRELREENTRLELESKLLNNTTEENNTAATPVTRPKTNIKAETWLMIAGGVGVVIGLFSPWQGGTFLTIGVVCLGLVYLRRQGKL